MKLTNKSKADIVNTIKDALTGFSEVNKIILFGSFPKSNNPNDIDIAVIQNSNNNFLVLSLKYRKVLRELSKIIPLDIVPIKQNINGTFLQEINKGEVIYERRD